MNVASPLSHYSSLLTAKGQANLPHLKPSGSPGLEWGGTAEALSGAHAAPQQGMGAVVRFPGA